MLAVISEEDVYKLLVKYVSVFQTLASKALYDINARPAEAAARALNNMVNPTETQLQMQERAGAVQGGPKPVMWDDVEELQNGLEKVQADVGTMQTDVRTMQTNVSTISTEITSFKTKVVSDIQETLHLMKAQMRMAGDRDKEVKALNDKYDAAQKVIAEMKEDCDKDMKALKDKYDAAQKVIKEMKDKHKAVLPGVSFRPIAQASSLQLTEGLTDAEQSMITGVAGKKRQREESLQSLDPDQQLDYDKLKFVVVKTDNAEDQVLVTDIYDLVYDKKLSEKEIKMLLARLTGMKRIGNVDVHEKYVQPITKEEKWVYVGSYAGKKGWSLDVDKLKALEAAREQEQENGGTASSRGHVLAAPHALRTMTNRPSQPATNVVGGEQMSEGDEDYSIGM